MLCVPRHAHVFHASALAICASSDNTLAHCAPGHSNMDILVHLTVERIIPIGETLSTPLQALCLACLFCEKPMPIVSDPPGTFSASANSRITINLARCYRLPFLQYQVTSCPLAHPLLWSRRLHTGKPLLCSFRHLFSSQPDTLQRVPCRLAQSASQLTDFGMSTDSAQQNLSLRAIFFGPCHRSMEGLHDVCRSGDRLRAWETS